MLGLLKIAERTEIMAKNYTNKNKYKYIHNAMKEDVY